MHPKNTTASQKAQVPVTPSFEVGDHDKDSYLQVRPGVLAVKTMEESSNYLAETLLFLNEHYDEDTGLKTSAVYLIQQHLITAKALLDASVIGIIAVHGLGGAQ